MQNVNPKAARTISWIAALISILVAVSLPAVYFALSYQNQVGALEAQAEINARLASQVINTNPTTWRFQTVKFEEFLSRRPRRGYPEVRRIVDTQDKVIAESVDVLKPPLITRSASLLDSGLKVARIEVSRSLQPLLQRTGLVALFGLFLSLAVFVTLRVLPLRVLNRALEKNAHLLEESERLRQEADQKAAELARSNTELQQFAYIASHDLQEPLRMVASYVQLLARRYKGKLDADADEFINFAVEGVLRMRGLIHALSAYSRLGMEVKEFEPTNCESVLAGALRNLWVAIEESGAVVTHDPLPTVLGDGTQLGQLFQNLIGNAIKYRSTEPSRIHVSSERNGKEWLFSVRDNGIGIYPQYAERIFVIFERLHAREKYPGTGIGLTLSKKIAERHGGRIWVESQPGKGSTFYFTIPV